jgi:hypothetical protein
MREAIRADWKTMTRRLGKCPYKVGDVLGIGEPHFLYVLQHQSSAPALGCRYEDGSTRLIPIGEDDARAYLDKVTVGLTPDCIFFRRPARRRSGRFLPDPFIRDRIRITAIRREPLQAITPADARREGAPELSGTPAYHIRGPQAYVCWFAALWDSLNGKRAGGARWMDNPEVWALSFTREIGS